MPTYDKTATFLRDWANLSTHERELYRRAVKGFVEDLEGNPQQFRKGLRVKGVQGAPGVYEMTWEVRDGRATWQYGPSVRPGEPHIVWRRIGGHAIFRAP